MRAADRVRPECAPGQLCNPHSPHSLPRTPQCHHFEDAYFWGATFRLGTAGLRPQSLRRAQTCAQGGVAPLLRNAYAWRCGDTCISWDAKCKCGDEIFKKEDQKWCCHNSCTPKGEKERTFDFYIDGTWLGEMERGKKIGTECTRRALNLTEACDLVVNDTQSDSIQ